MQILLKQNLELKKSVEIFLQEIQKQKELNAQHQKQIQTLLKFNQRLLGIIQNQLTNSKKDNCSLQPISQRSERESDLVIPSMQSMIRLRKFGGTKSERGGYSTNNLVERVNQSGNKLDIFNCEILQSEVDYSPEQREQDKPITQREHAVPASVIVTSSLNRSDDVKNQISNQITELKKFRDQSNKFYDSKIHQVRELSSKIKKTSPLQQLNKISEKLTLSATTSNLIKQTLNKTKN